MFLLTWRVGHNCRRSRNVDEEEEDEDEAERETEEMTSLSI